MTRRRCQQKSVPDSAIVEHMDTDNNDNIDVISVVPMTEVVKGKSDIPIKRGKRKNTGVKDEDNKEQQLEYYLSDYPVLIQKATVNVKGQKTLIKRLWSDHEEVVEKCTINDLRRALWEPTFISCPEGIKLCAYALRKIGIRSAFLLMKKMILGGATNSTCNHLGEVIYSAWKMANKEENEQLKQDIEHEMITGSAHDAIFIPEPFSSKFMHILSAFSNIKTEKAKYDGMLYKCFEPILWRGLLAHNDKIRYAASSILLSFYPLIDDDEFKRVECLEKQHKVLENMLKDDCVMIRTEASKKILRILSLFWTYIPKQFIKNYLTYIIDNLARDNVVGIRLAIFEGIRYLLPVPSCLNASEHALKCIGLNGINDKNERVRIAAFQMLRALKGHRYIRFFDVVSMDDILARLEIEPSESVRKEIVPLIFKSFFPDRDHVDQNERMRRASFLVKQGRICALTFHRLIFPLNLVSVKEAVEHIQFLTILVYRISAKGLSADSTIDTTIGLDDTIATTVTLSGANQEYNVPDENNEVWQRNKVLMECVVVLWMSLRKALMESKYAVEKKKLDNMETKMFKKMFQCFRTTSLVGTTMVIGSMLPQSSMDGITQSVLSLLNEKAVDECVLEPYLEATAQWRIEYLFDIIESGLLLLQSNLSQSTSPPAKKGKKSLKLSPVDRLRKALHYLKYLMRSYTTNQMITCNHVFQLEQFYQKLCMIRLVIDSRLSRDSFDVGIPDDIIVEAFETKQTLAAVLLNCKSRGEEEIDHSIRFTRDMCEELQWFDNDIVAKMALLDNDCRMPFLIKLSETILRNIGLSLATWDFSKIPTTSLYEDNNENDNYNNMISFPELASRIVISFCNSNTPASLISPVLHASRQLLTAENDNDICSLISVLDFVPKWILNSVKREEVLDEKRISEAYIGFWKAIMEHEQYTDVHLQKKINVVAILLLNHLTENNEELNDIPDPRLHDYEVKVPISLILHKVIFKSRVLIRLFKDRLGGLFCSDSLFSPDLDIGSCLIRLGSCVQLTFLSDMESFGGKRHGKERCSEDTKNLLEILRQRVDQVVQNRPSEDMFILQQLRELLEMN